MAKLDKQTQILMALDKIAERLVSIEKERDSMRDELITAQNKGQDDTQQDAALASKAHARLVEIEQEYADLMRKFQTQEKASKTLGEKLDKLESEKQKIAEGTSENLRNALNESLQIQREMRRELESNALRQARIEEELSLSEQRHIALMRKMETMGTKYQRLSRRIDRVETLSQDAQDSLINQLQLLIGNDHAGNGGASINLENTNFSSSTAAFPLIAKLQTANDQAAAPTPFWDRESTRKAVSACIVAVMIGMIGFGIWKTNYDVPARTLSAQTDQFYADENTISAVRPAAGTSSTEDIFLAARAFNDPLFAAELNRDRRLSSTMSALERQAFEGDAEAQHDLAALYSAGQEGVPQDFERAAYWFHEAGRQGIANARYNLGVLYHQGLGVDQNIDQAVYWYAQSAGLGHPEAQYNLGIAYIEGIGTPYDPDLAVDYFRNSAMAGVPEAAYNLGLILENGLVGPARKEEAIFWYAYAADLGNASAQAALETLRRDDGYSAADIQTIKSRFERALAKDFEARQKRIENLVTHDDTVAVEESKAQPLEVAPLNAQDKTGTQKPANENNWQQLVKDVQTHLRGIALYPGPQDGVYGPRTRDAIVAYQSLYGLDKTGQPSRDLLSHMRDYAPLEQGSAGSASE